VKVELHAFTSIPAAGELLASRTSRHYRQRKNSRYIFDRRLIGPHSISRCSHCRQIWRWKVYAKVQWKSGWFSYMLSRNANTDCSNVRKISQLYIVKENTLLEMTIDRNPHICILTMGINCQGLQETHEIWLPYYIDTHYDHMHDRTHTHRVCTVWDIEIATFSCEMYLNRMLRSITV
jgi:hypothetical protein